MKIILIILDGLGDRSYEILNHRTPLQAADTPNLNRLAYLGSNGLFHPSSPGECLPSETAHYLLFGYDLKKFPGRGLLEAVGEGVVFDDRDVLCLAHLSGVTWKGGVPILTRGRRDVEKESQDLDLLYAAITGYETCGIRFRLVRTGRNDAILVMSGRVSPYISDSDPMLRGKAVARIQPLLDNPEPEKAALTARALNDYLSWCHRVLSNYRTNRSRRVRSGPGGNFLATQRAGRRVAQEPFHQRWGLSGMLVASSSVYGGLAHELSITFIRAKDSRDPGKDLRERIRSAFEESSHDFVLVHTKAADEAAHAGDPSHKRSIIAALDRGLDGLIKRMEAGDDFLVAVTADHSTPSISKLIHSGEPVPVVLVGQNTRRDGVEAFDEVNAVTGCLGLLRGPELMLTILNYADRSSLQGHRLGKAETPYFPQTYKTFKMTGES